MADRTSRRRVGITRRLVLAGGALAALIGPGTPARGQTAAAIRRLLIDLPGWTASPASTFNSVAEILIQREYTRDDATLLATLEIGLLGPPTAFGALTTHAPDQTPRKATVDGFAVESIHITDEDSGAIVVTLVNDKKRPAVFLLEYDGLSADAAMEIARDFDWPAMRQAVRAAR